MGDLADQKYLDEIDGLVKEVDHLKHKLQLANASSDRKDEIIKAKESVIEVTREDMNRGLREKNRQIEALKNELEHEKRAVAAKEGVVVYMREEMKRRKEETDMNIAALNNTIERYRELRTKEEEEKEELERDFKELGRVSVELKVEVERLRNSTRNQFEEMLKSVLADRTEGRTPEEKFKLMEILVLSQIANEVGNIRLIIEKEPVPTSL